jgi:ABC-type branched-subunit amino acid transport system substrate-binding protein
MAIESVSSFNAGFTVSRPPDAAPDARDAVEQQNDAMRIAEADRGASPQYVSAPQQTNATPAGGGGVDAGAVVNDPEGSIQRAQTLIQNVNANGAPSEAESRRAAEAYQAASAAQNQIAQSRQAEGAQSLDILA